MTVCRIYFVKYTGFTEVTAIPMSSAREQILKPSEPVVRTVTTPEAVDGAVISG